MQAAELVCMQHILLITISLTNTGIVLIPDASNLYGPKAIQNYVRMKPWSI